MESKNLGSVGPWANLRMLHEKLIVCPRTHGLVFHQKEQWPSEKILTHFAPSSSRAQGVSGGARTAMVLERL